MTNDDTSMLWKIEGLGDHLNRVNLDIIWQHVAMSRIYHIIPDFFGIYGYGSVALWSGIFLSISYFFSNENKNIKSITFNLITSATMLLLVLTNLQWTMTSAAMFGVSYFLFQKSKHNKLLLLLSFIFFLISTLIRWNMSFYLAVCLITSHFVFSRKIFLTSTVVFLSIFITLITNSHLMKDNDIHRGWAKNQDNRVKVLDDSCGKYLENNYQSIPNKNLTVNDVTLFRHWFLINKKINNNILNDEIVSFCAQKPIVDRLINGLKWLNKLLSKDLIFITLLLIVSLFMTKNFKNIFVIIMILGSFFLFGIMGKPPRVRLIMSILTIISFINLTQFKRNNTKLITILTLLGFIVWSNIWPKLNLFRWRKNYYLTEFNVINRSIEKNPNAKIWWWAYGGNYVEWMYPIVRNDLNKDLQLYNLTHDWGDRDDPDFIKIPKYFEEGFTSAIGASIIFYDYIYEERGHWFNTYCKEHYGKDLKTKIYENKENELSKIVVVNMSCT